jgi:hypothetical protein
MDGPGKNRPAMLIRPLRGLSRRKTSPARHNPQRFRKVAALSPHDEIEEITAYAAAEAVENLFPRVDVERRVPLLVERAEAEILPPGSAQPRVAASDSNEIGAGLHIARDQQG